MGRRRKDSGDSFSYGEKALAGPISKSAFQYINDGGFLPSGPDLRVVKRVATIGAFMAAGVPLVIAARIASALVVEFDKDGGEAPSGLKALAEHKITPEEAASLPAKPNDYWYHALVIRREEQHIREILRSHGDKASLSGVPVTSDTFNYWHHRALVRQRREHLMNSPAYKFDTQIEICDRRHVFMLPSSRLKDIDDSDFKKKLSDLYARPGFVGWIDGWERGSEARFVHVSEKINFNHDHSRASGVRLQAMAEQEVLHSVVGKLTVNLSLAIRRALERISEGRAGVVPEAPSKQSRADAQASRPR